MIECENKNKKFEIMINYNYFEGFWMSEYTIGSYAKKGIEIAKL